MTQIVACIIETVLNISILRYFPFDENKNYLLTIFDCGWDIIESLPYISC